jgi:two-component system, LuxR family, sensor kinase FixL
VTEQNSRQDLQALLDAAVDAIVVIDHLGSIQSFNRTAETLFGYRDQEVIGRNVRMLMTQDDGDMHDRHLAQFVATRVPHIVGRGREVRAKRRDGTVFPAMLSVGVVQGADPPRFVGFLHDVTESHRAEAESHGLQDRLMHVSRLATVGEMASGIAHELNQPLAAIATYAHACDRLLSIPDPDIEEVQEALRQIAAQAVRAGDIIRKLRSLARTEELSRAPHDVNEVIAELADLIDSDAKAHGVKYRSELATGLPLVVLDKPQIQQVVMNLVRNALEAFALGRLDAAEIVVKTSRTPAGDVQVSVCDNGPGVDPAVALRIFDPFCSTKPTGTGLGLPISRTIATTHGGTLEHKSNAPKGACFVLGLPATSMGTT